MLKLIRIISRNSRLAIWQAEFVRDLLLQNYPGLVVEISGITTEGDRILDKSLEKIGGKGLFIKELEHHLLAETADIAVHSLKDLPAKLPKEFALAAILARENPADGFISNHFANLAELPIGGVVGTSSARRIAALHHYYPHLQTKLLRGNLQTRLAKLDNAEYDAIILAVSGLERLGLGARVKQVLPLGEFVPAIGQGALAVEVLAHRHELCSFLAPLHDVLSAQAVGAEREMGRYLNASCNIPLAGWARIINGQLNLSAFIADSEQNSFLQASASGEAGNYLELGRECANQLLAKGANKIVDKYSRS